MDRPSELVPDIIARWGPDLRCRYINQAVKRKTGLPPEWFLGKTNAEAGQPPNICELWDKALRQVFATGESGEKLCATGQQTLICLHDRGDRPPSQAGD